MERFTLASRHILYMEASKQMLFSISKTGGSFGISTAKLTRIQNIVETVSKHIHRNGLNPVGRDRMNQEIIRSGKITFFES